MKLSPEAWAALIEILNIEFVLAQQTLSEETLKQLILAVAQDFPLSIDANKR